MKQKHIKTLSLLASLLFASANAAATDETSIKNMLFSQPKTSNLVQTDNLRAKTILVLQGNTDHEYVAQSQMKLYIGSNASCSDLHLVGISESKKVRIASFTNNITSETLTSSIGNSQGCMKIDLTVNDNAYSSGNIQLGWDANSNSYTSANPAKVVFDLSKGDQGNV